MTKELIISANVHEKKVAILEDGVVTEFYVERRDENQGVVGNLYKGRVMKVLPGMQSAFVDIGLDRDAFLYVSDFTEFMEDEEEIDFKEMGDEAPAPAPPPRYEDRPRREDRQRPAVASASRQPAPEPVVADARESSPIEDVVEQLAEIADESVIAPPDRDEDLEGAALGSAAGGAAPQPDEAQVLPVEEFIDERFTEVAPSRYAEESAASPAPLFEAVTDLPAEERPGHEESIEATAAETEPAEVETAEEKPKRTKARKKAAGSGTETEAKKTSRKTTKKAEPAKAKQKPAESKARKTASKPAGRGSRKRSNTANSTESAREPGPPLERVTDDDITPGDLLKDAIVEEKIIDRIHDSEYKIGTFQAAPEPEWRVGSFRPQPGGESGLQRVIDEAAASAAEETNAPASLDDLAGEGRAAGAGELEAPVVPFRHISEVVPSELYQATAGAEGSGELAEVGGLLSPGQEGEVTESESRGGAAEAGDGEYTESGGAGEADLPDEDRQAEVGTRRRRADFAIRRGNRGRRRRPRDPQGGPAVAGEDDKGGQAVAAEAPEAEVAEKPAPEVAEPRPKPDDRSRARSGDQAQVRSRPDRRPDERRPDDRRPDDRRPDGRFERRPEGGRRAEQSQARRPERGGPPTISELLHEGQEILVQIAKEPIAKKGARITSHMALPGRLLVYMPTVNHVGVSRKIPNEMERIRLKRLVASLREREGGTGGFIARTACAGHSEQELQDDMRYLIRTWTDVRKKAERSKAPALVHRDLDLVQRILRDQLSDEFTAIRVDNEVEYARIVEFVNRVQPKLVKRVKLYTGSQPVLEKYGVQAEIDKAVRPRVWLKSGGYIVINQTEALVAIDVNTGKFVGKSDKLEDTITRTNLEAAKEIVRQIRLRDLGGIIVIDFIDMEERKNRQRVMVALQQELQTDRSPSKILSINDFGLVAITRKRVKQSLERTLCTPCPYCQGAGMVKSPQTMCFEILEQAKAMARQVVESNDVMLRVSPDVAEAFHTTESEVLEEIEAYFGTPVTIEADPNLHQEQYDFALQ